MFKLLSYIKQKISKKPRRVFLDFASATPVRPEVLSLMTSYTQKYFANPSALYLEARKTKEILLDARAQVAKFLNTAKERIVFTGGGTEANNIALLGVFESAQKKGIAHPHIISILTEHPSVREVLEEIKRRGGEVTLLSPDAEGLVTASQVINALTPSTVLVSLMYVNNEIGVAQPIKEITQGVRIKNKELRIKNGEEYMYPYVHTDACQAALFYNLDVSTLGVDLLTLDGLKIGGPVGVGCLYVRNGVEHDISPVMFGGGQENGLRSGTENISGILGFAKALECAKKEREDVSNRLKELRDYFMTEIFKRFPTAELNGSKKYRSPNNVNVCFPGIDSEYLVVALDTYGVSASYSSSCRTLKEDSSSYVVEALGKPDCALSSVRFTLGRITTKSDIDFALNALEKALHQVAKK